MKILPDILPEGLPPGNVILSTAPPGCGKTILGMQFIDAALSEGKKVVFVSTDASPKETMMRMGHFSWGGSKAYEDGRLIFVDCYSWRMGYGRESKNVFSVDSLVDLGTIGIKISDALDNAGDDAALLFDSLSPIILHSSSDAAIHFIEMTFAKLKERGLTAMINFEKGVHDEKIVNVIRSMVDGIIEFKLEEEDGELMHYIRVFSMKDARYVNKWIRFQICPCGISLEPGRSRIISMGHQGHGGSSRQ